MLRECITLLLIGFKGLLHPDSTARVCLRASGDFSVNLKMLSAGALLAACTLTSAARSQDVMQPMPQTGAETATDAADAVPQPPVAAERKLPALTPVELEIITAASSKTSHQGDQIRIRVAAGVSVDGMVVLPAGTEGFAEVIQVSHGAFGGKAGELVLGAPYVMLDGQKIGLKRFGYGPSSGRDRFGQAMVATALVGVAGMFIGGGNIDIASGTRANAVVTTDTIIHAQP
jgi:hypothetical protein